MPLRFRLLLHEIITLPPSIMSAAYIDELAAYAFLSLRASPAIDISAKQFQHISPSSMSYLALLMLIVPAIYIERAPISAR